jgi:hypothetical protein
VDEKVDAPKVSPPQSIIIQSSNSDNVNDTSTFSTFPGAEGMYDDNMIVVPVDEKPPKELLGGSLLLIIISTVGFFFIDTGFINGDFMCCLVCNGNSIGLVLLGTYSAQYGKWERTVGAKFSSVVSVTGAVLMYIVAAILFALWLLFATY